MRDKHGALLENQIIISKRQKQDNAMSRQKSRELSNLVGESNACSISANIFGEPAITRCNEVFRMASDIYGA